MALEMTLDRQFDFLTKEIQSLSGRREGWAADKQRKLEAVRETIRKLRQQESMTSSITGKGIGE